MKILFVAPWVPTERRPRSLGLLNTLAERHDVTVLVAAWSKSEARDAAGLPGAVEIVRMSKAAGLVRAGLAVFTRRSLQQAYVGSLKFKRRVGELTKQISPDVVYVNVIRTAETASSLSDVKLVLDIDEMRSKYYEQVAREGRPSLLRIVSKLEWRRMRRAERRAVERFCSVLVSSPVDLEPDLPSIQLVRSPHALQHTNDPGQVGRENRLVFVGRMSYAANQQAIKWFVENVFLDLQRTHAGLELDIVGENPSRAIVALGAAPGVNVTGRVPTVANYYAAAAVSIVPVFHATGVQMKLIESLFMGVPTVTTSRVARQAGVENRVQCLVADSPEEWQRAVSSLLGDADLRESLATQGREWVRRHYTPEMISTDLLRSLEATAK